MSKLLSLKEWLTLSEGAAYLSTVFKEEVTVADMYRFSLADRLTLSINLINHARGNIGLRERIEDAGFKILPAIVEAENRVMLSITSGAIPSYEKWLDNNESASKEIAATLKRGVFICLNGEQISDTECIQFEKEVRTLDGLWDLTLIGAERVDIEHRLQMETSGHPVELICLGGVVLRSNDRYARLLEKFDEKKSDLNKSSWGRDDPADYYPAGALPEDAPIVVVPAALNRFVNDVLGRETIAERSLGTRERNGLLRIIAGLAAEARVPLHGEKTAVQITAAGKRFGGPDEKTVRKVVADIRENVLPEDWTD